MREDILALVAKRSGMVFAPNRRMEADAGIARAMGHAGARDLAAYFLLVGGSGRALDDLIDELTVGETHFMRDPDQLELVRSQVLPALRRRRTSGTPVRVWSAGCATGEEAYTLAILLEEEGLHEGAVVLGTDLSAPALKKARAGSYTDWSMRGVSARFREDYFRYQQGRRLLVDRIRSRVRFERLNLTGPEDYRQAGAYAMDLILCRNVLIYFDHATAASVAARLFNCLAEGGVLLTAGADLLLGEHAPFQVEVTRVGLVYRRPFGPPLMRSHLDAVAATPYEPGAGNDARAIAAPVVAVPAPAAPPLGPDRGREAFQHVMREANASGALAAERAAQAALRLHPLDAHLHYLRAVLLLALDRDAEAENEARRALYLDASLVVAHFLLGTIQRKDGGHPAALRSFRNARDLSAGRPADEEVPGGTGERMGALHLAVLAEMAELEGSLAPRA